MASLDSGPARRGFVISGLSWPDGVSLIPAYIPELTKSSGFCPHTAAQPPVMTTSPTAHSPATCREPRSPRPPGHIMPDHGVDRDAAQLDPGAPQSIPPSTRTGCRTADATPAAAPRTPGPAPDDHRTSKLSEHEARVRASLQSRAVARRETKRVVSDTRHGGISPPPDRGSPARRRRAGAAPRTVRCWARTAGRDGSGSGATGRRGGRGGRSTGSAASTHGW